MVSSFTKSELKFVEKPFSNTLWGKNVGIVIATSVVCVFMPYVYNALLPRRVDEKRASGIGHDLAQGTTPSPMGDLRLLHDSGQTLAAMQLQA